jgi:hypothetical protein
MVNIHTGLCSECQNEFENEQKKPVEPPKPLELTLEFPTIYIGNCLKCRLIEKFTDVRLDRPAIMPDFSLINLCDDVSFSVDGDVVTAKRPTQSLGTIANPQLVSKIIKSLDENRPIFSQIQGFDDETGEIDIVLGFYKILNYDYDSYTEDNDKSLELENVGYF